MHKRKILLGIAFVVFLGLYLMVQLNWSNANDTTFATDAFYTGNQGDPIDYKELYDALYVGLAPGSGECRTEMMHADNGAEMENGNTIETCMAGRYQWITPKAVSSSADIGTGTVIAPYNDGDVIISPGNLKFINSNIVQESVDSIYIEAILGNKYVIRWDDVECWWCHIGKENKSKHSKVVGNNGIYATCTSGYIIGQAKASTTVSFFTIDTDGNMTPIDVQEVFGTF